MSNDKNNMSEEDFLKKHLSDVEKTNNIQKDDITSFIEPTSESSSVNDLQYFNFGLDQLPCGKFYPMGTTLLLRPAKVKEIQAYSMVDDNNFYDVIEKMNGMLQSCVRIKYPDGKVGSYLELKDPDRLYLIFVIRELTFQQGNALSVNTICPTDNTEMQIELTRKNFIFHETDPKLEKFFNPINGSYKFKIKNNKEFEITPPNIGLQKAFADYIIKENSEKRSPNLAFLKIIPFMLNGRSHITYEGIKAKLNEFEEMDDISFQFLNSAVSKMTFGIKELRKNCGCGTEVRTDMQFPNGASGIFVIHDAFEAYIEE